MPRLDELLVRYEEAMHGRGYTPRTITTFLENLRQFAQFLAAQQISDPLRVTPGQLEEFRGELLRTPTRRGLPRRSGTVNLTLAAVRSFYRVLCDCDVIPYDPTRRLAMVREPRRLPPPVLKAEEVAKLLDSIDPSTPLGGRDRALFELMYSTGARLGEMQGLEVEDVDLGERLCRLRRCKGGKQRVVPFGPVAEGHLENYLRWIRPAFARRRATRVVWLSSQGQPLHKRTIEGALCKYLRATGIGKRLTPHGLRHACATHLLERHADLRHIQELLGHASVETTQVYTHLDVQHLKETLQRCHPRERGTINDGEDHGPGTTPSGDGLASDRPDDRGAAVRAAGSDAAQAAPAGSGVGHDQAHPGDASAAKRAAGQARRGRGRPTGPA